MGKRLELQEKIERQRSLMDKMLESGMDSEKVLIQSMILDTLIGEYIENEINQPVLG